MDWKNALAGRTIALTGASGFVGSKVLNILTSETAVLSNAGKPALVKALMHDTDISKLTLDDDSKSESVPITTVQGRITALEDVKRLCQGCDVLINCAGCYRWWTRDPEAMRSVNEDGARIVGLAAAEIDAVVVQVSTVLAQRRSSLYARTKADGDAHLKKMADEGKISLTTCRLACCIGADPRLLDRDRDVLRLEALVKQEISITLGHSTEYVYIGVDDAAAAIVRAAAYTYAKRATASPSSRFTSLDIGAEALSTAEYYELIAGLAGVPVPKMVVPLWVARLYSLFDSAIAHRFPQRSAPLSPPDLLQTVAAGSLLWKLDTAQALLDLQFSPIRGQMKEAVELIQKQAKGNDHDHGEK